MSSSFYELDSFTSGISIYDDKNLIELQEIATQTAIDIFEEYFVSSNPQQGEEKGQHYLKENINQYVVESLFVKFGVMSSQNGQINLDILQVNLNEQLFLEVYENAFTTLQISFNYFKKSELFSILKEDINRDEKLY